MRQDDKCQRCGQPTPIESAHTVLRGTNPEFRKWIWAWLCETCADELVAMEEKEVTK